MQAKEFLGAGVRKSYKDCGPYRWVVYDPFVILAVRRAWADIKQRIPQTMIMEGLPFAALLVAHDLELTQDTVTGQEAAEIIEPYLIQIGHEAMGWTSWVRHGFNNGSHTLMGRPASSISRAQAVLDAKKLT